MFHLGWFVGRGYSPHQWSQPWSGAIGTDFMEPDIYMDLARALERAHFDCLIIEDGSYIADAYQGSAEYYLRTGYSTPKHDPMPLVPLIGYVTKHLGIIPTVTTSFYPPYLAARLGATLDHLTHGRLGLNVVTAHNDRSAQNFGLDRHYEHDHRYVMADEWMQVVNALWDSWEPGAIVADPVSGVLTDHTKVQPIHFEGRFYKCRGPLNTAPGPQGRPVICQAGGSPAGRDFAAKHAELIIAKVRGVAAAKAEPRGHLTPHGSAWPHAHGLQGVVLHLRHHRRNDAGGTGQARSHGGCAEGVGRGEAGRHVVPQRHRLFQTRSGCTATGAEDQRLAHLVRGLRGGRRQDAARDAGGTHGWRYRLRRHADSIASDMQAAMEEIGGDGILIQDPLTRKAVSEITDGLVPALKRRGVVRTAYPHALFRDNLLAF